MCINIPLFSPQYNCTQWLMCIIEYHPTNYTIFYIYIYIFGNYIAYICCIAGHLYMYALLSIFQCTYLLLSLTEKYLKSNNVLNSYFLAPIQEPAHGSWEPILGVFNTMSFPLQLNCF